MILHAPYRSFVVHGQYRTVGDETSIDIQDNILTELGEFLTTEAGEYILYDGYLAKPLVLHAPYRSFRVHGVST